ncbi:MAG: hypothetical protein K9N51_10310 [Candidatus Pacebacteria bacterium]|nr:hypothetical protein [Candidatus Paceibacterota bacterium]
MVAGLFWEAHQQGRISQASANAATARNRAARLETDIKHLERKVERMALSCQALWELLRDRTDLEEDDILQKMQEIDVRDGTSDGKIGHKVLTCPACNRTANSSRTTCLYCGSELRRQHVFE